MAEEERSDGEAAYYAAAGLLDAIPDVYDRANVVLSLVRTTMYDVAAHELSRSGKDPKDESEHLMLPFFATACHTFIDQIHELTNESRCEKCIAKCNELGVKLGKPDEKKEGPSMPSKEDPKKTADMMRAAAQVIEVVLPFTDEEDRLSIMVNATKALVSRSHINRQVNEIIDVKIDTAPGSLADLLSSIAKKVRERAERDTEAPPAPEQAAADQPS